MAVERNLQVQLGETWRVQFDAGDALSGADLDLDLSLGETLKLSLSDAMSPSPFAVNQPAPYGVATVSPGDQIDLAPETYLYEIRASYPATGIVTVIQFGRLMVGASLFAWPEQSI